MTELLLRFAIILESHDFSEINQHYGPLFSKWLPDGKNDAHVVHFSDPAAEVAIWFERMGYISTDDRNGGYITFDYEKREVDPDTIKRQAVIEGGPLFGSVKLSHLTQNQIEPILHNMSGDERYVRLGKQIVTKLIYPCVSRLIGILSVNYGQYWIRPLIKWDSREESLGHYCKYRLQLKYSVDNGETWAPFIPNDPTSAPITLKGRLETGADYINENDWEMIGQLLKQSHSPSLASITLVRAHSLYDQGHTKYALFEAVTALEIAMYECIELKLKNNRKLLSVLDSFWNLSMPTKVTTIAGILGTISLHELQETIEAINIRNDLMHEGKSLPDDIDPKLMNVIKTVSKIINGPVFKFPTKASLNSLSAPEKK